MELYSFGLKPQPQTLEWHIIDKTNKRTSLVYYRKIDIVKRAIVLALDVLLFQKLNLAS